MKPKQHFIINCYSFLLLFFLTLVRDHSNSTYATFSEKLTFLNLVVGTSILLDVFKGYRSAYQELRNVSLSGNLAYVLYE